MTAFRRSPITASQEAQLVKLLQLWSAGEIKLRDITARTKRDYNALRRLIEKHKISYPPRFSY